MIDMTKEQVFSLSQATRFVPAVDGKRVHTSTLWRWCTRGCRGVKLEHIRLGRRMLTSQEAINRFGNRLAQKEERELTRHNSFSIKTSNPMNDSERTNLIQKPMSVIGSYCTNSELTILGEGIVYQEILKARIGSESGVNYWTFFTQESLH